MQLCYDWKVVTSVLKGFSTSIFRVFQEEHIAG